MIIGWLVSWSEVCKKYGLTWWSNHCSMVFILQKFIDHLPSKKQSFHTQEMTGLTVFYMLKCMSLTVPCCLYTNLSSHAFCPPSVHAFQIILLLSTHSSSSCWNSHNNLMKCGTARCLSNCRVTLLRDRFWFGRLPANSSLCVYE